MICPARACPANSLAAGGCPATRLCDLLGDQQVRRLCAGGRRRLEVAFERGSVSIREKPAAQPGFADGKKEKHMLFVQY